MVAVLRACDRLACEIFFVPRLYELHTVTRGTEVLWGIPLVRLRRAPFRTGAWAAKRVSDVVDRRRSRCSSSRPSWLVCALLSRWETGSRPVPPDPHRPRRPAVHPAEVLLAAAGGGVRVGSTAWNIGAGRAGCGRVGRFLRRTSLDELPQLWNVAARRHEPGRARGRSGRSSSTSSPGSIPWYTARHRVPVGLTGWAQVHGLRGDTSIADRARFDNFYIENWSMWGDIKILLRTVGQVLGGAGR